MKYFVEVKEIGTAYVEVEALSKEKAEEIAIGKYLNADTGVMYDGIIYECKAMAADRKDLK